MVYGTMMDVIFTKKCSSCLHRTKVTRIAYPWKCSNCGVLLHISFGEKARFWLIGLVGTLYVTLTLSNYIYRPEILVFILLIYINYYFSVGVEK